MSPGRREGCLGEPSMFFPRQKTGAPKRERCVAMLLISSWKTGFDPQATTILGALRHTRSTQSIFSGPTRSGVFNKPLQSVLLKANKFTTIMPPAPSWRAKWQHMLIVLSSFIASAVLGFSMTKTKGAKDSSHLRHRTYRYCSHTENFASFSDKNLSGQAGFIDLPLKYVELCIILSSVLPF